MTRGLLYLTSAITAYSQSFLVAEPKQKDRCKIKCVFYAVWYTSKDSAAAGAQGAEAQPSDGDAAAWRPEFT